MIPTSSSKSRTWALMLAAVLLLSFFGAFSGSALSGAPAPQLPLDEGLNATVQIKTQKAADNIKGGIRGIDVSKYQGDINWKKVAKDDVDFAFIRASYGTTADPYFVTNAKGAHENGLGVGAYHFATFTTTAQMKKEAKYFISRLEKVNITYPVVLDLEGASHKNIKKSTLTKLAKGFMDIVSDEGYEVLFYTYENFLTAHIDVSKLGGYNLWIANYVQQPTSHDHHVWQHTSYGTVKGIKGRVDINIAYTDLSTKKRKKKTSSTTTATTTTSTSVNVGSGNNSSQQDTNPVRTTTATPTPTKATTKRNVTVSKKISNSIKTTLNERYSLGIPIDGLDMEKINTGINKGIQYEINRQWGYDLKVNGTISDEQFEALDEVTFTSSTKGNITYLLQAKLFYKGYYTGSLSAQFDANTVSALKEFQEDNGLTANGKVNTKTLKKLLA